MGRRAGPPRPGAAAGTRPAAPVSAWECGLPDLFRPGVVLALLVRYGLPGVLSGLLVRSWGPPAAALCRAFERLGPAFVKLGQFLSVRPDLVPPEAILEFERLQDRAAPVPLSRITGLVERELGAPLTDLFRQFAPEPLACASLSQVHRAVLPEGTAVAVKVQRPEAARALRRDLALAGRLVTLAVAVSPMRGRLHPAALWAELVHTAEAELDFRREAEVAEAMARNLARIEGVRVPRVHWGWTSRRVLTTDFVEGRKISDPTARETSGYTYLAELGARAFLEQVLEHGLFHADLHPANILITPAGEIAYLDFGIWGRLSRDERQHVLGALAGLLARDPPLAVRHLERLGVHVPPERIEPFAADVARIMDQALVPRLADLSLGQIGRELLGAVYRHRVVFPRRHALLVKALLTIEGTARLLHPEFSFEGAARRYLFESTKSRLSLLQLAEAAWRGAALLGFGALTPPVGGPGAPPTSRRGP